MAHVTNCIYCERQLINKPWCPECRLAFSEGLLGNIQALIRKGKIRGLPSKLQEIISCQIFTSPTQLTSEWEKEKKLALRQQLEESQNQKDFLAFVEKKRRRQRKTPPQYTY
jgi:hypothetical protein